MNLQQLRYVIEVERTGSITQAAENLFMGQPNLSKAIRELEREIGVDIFHRSSRGIDLTEKGKIFLSYAKNVVAQIQEMQDLGKTEDQENLRFSCCMAIIIGDVLAEMSSCIYSYFAYLILGLTMVFDNQYCINEYIK